MYNYGGGGGFLYLYSVLRRLTFRSFARTESLSRVWSCVRGRRSVVLTLRGVVGRRTEGGREGGETAVYLQIVKVKFVGKD